MGKDRALDLDAVVLATHGGPGEDGSLQAALDLAGVRYTGPTVAGAALGMDKWSFGAVMAPSGIPTLPRALLDASTTVAALRRAVHLEAAIRRVLDRHRRGGRPRDGATRDSTSNPHLALGCVVEPYRADLADIQIAVRTLSRRSRSRRSSVPFAATTTPRSWTTATSTSAAKAWCRRRANCPR